MSSISALAPAGTGVSTPAKSGGTSPQPDTAQASSPATGLPKFYTPRIYLDPILDIVIFESRDPQTGTVTSSVPSQQQLYLYRAHLAQPPSPGGEPTNAGAGGVSVNGSVGTLA